MKSLEQVRRTEVKQPDGSWLCAHMEQLEPGDVFRMFEPHSGLPVVSPIDSTTEWLVASEASVEIKPGD